MKIRSLAPALALLLSLVTVGCSEPEPIQPVREAPWSPEVVELFGELPLQAGGRVKPLSTFAGFQLLKMNGRRKVVVHLGPEDAPADELLKAKLSPTEWLLDCLFFPEDAERYPTFLVQDSQVLVNVGMKGKKKRDRYSYEELKEVREKLFQEAREVAHKESKDMDSLERQTLALATNIRDFEDLVHSLDFARHGYSVGGSERVAALFGGAETTDIGTLLASSAELREVLREMDADRSAGGRQEFSNAMRVMDEVEFYLQRAGGGLALFAPEGTGETDPYTTPLETLPDVFALESAAESDAHAVVDGLAGMIAARNDREVFRVELEDLHDVLVGRADARGEYSKIPLETSFYRYDFFTKALVFYLLGFVVLAFSWLRPGNPVLGKAVWACVLTATLLVTVGVAWRCILRSRPPVSTLYETILFITGVAAFVCMAIEWINPHRIALGTASVLGALGMFLSMKYELKEAVTSGDTMPSLVAVLDTNFWLATHVTTVTMGYAAGLLAAALAHVWIFAKLFGLKRGDKSFFREVTRMTYGVLCFGLFFSIVGTVLGGIWANYSWGRFWGWDPKENGALLICLWMLMILHLRLGGHVKQFGIAVMSVLGGLVVAFSWWGVNLLSVGLHSYGFTDGIFMILVVFYTLELLVVMSACIWKLAARTAQSLPEPG